MPETKIHVQRLKAHFRRLWVIYLVGILLLCFLNHMVFTVSRPRFSEEETLKIMLLNVDTELDATALLEKVQMVDDTIRAVEFVPLATVSTEDASSMMLLSAQLVGGFGDIYCTDSAGLDALEKRYACLSLSDMQLSGWEIVRRVDAESGEMYAAALRQTDGEIYLVVAKNGTNIESSIKTLSILAEEIME